MSRVHCPNEILEVGKLRVDLLQALLARNHEFKRDARGGTSTISQLVLRDFDGDLNMNKVLLGPNHLHGA